MSTSGHLILLTDATTVLVSIVRETTSSMQTYDILVRIHEDIKLILFGYPKDLDGEGNPLLVIEARTSMLDGLPREDIADSIVSQTSEPLEVNVRVLQREGPPNEGDIISLKEPVWLI